MKPFIVFLESDDRPLLNQDGVVRNYTEVQIGESAKEVAERYLGKFDTVTVFSLQADPVVFQADMVEQPGPAF